MYSCNPIARNSAPASRETKLAPPLPPPPPPPPGAARLRSAFEEDHQCQTQSSLVIANIGDRKQKKHTPWGWESKIVVLRRRGAAAGARRARRLWWFIITVTNLRQLKSRILSKVDKTRRL
jgi:hypothetical protein